MKKGGKVEGLKTERQLLFYCLSWATLLYEKKVKGKGVMEEGGNPESVEGEREKG